MQRKALAVDKRKRRQLQQKAPIVAETTIQRKANDQFVTKFATVMQTFPESWDKPMSIDDKLIVRDFFVRVAHFSDRKMTTFDPGMVNLAFLFVNFPQSFISTGINPFGVSLLFRSFSFVSAIFQVVIDCNPAEDDTVEEFLPEATARNFIFRMCLFEDALNQYEAMNELLKDKSNAEMALIRNKALREQASIDARLLD